MPFPHYIKNRFGSKRGLLKLMSYFLKTYLGQYQCYGPTSLSEKPRRYVFICSGNICRSPLAEYVAKHMGANAISFGLHTRGGDPADPRAINFAKTIGIDLNPHITKNIKDYVPQAGDLLVGMEPKHAHELTQIIGDEVPITLAGLWLAKKQAYIHDPYNTTPIFFDACEHLVQKAVEQLVHKNR